jgi:hypothetical protein
MQVVLIQWKVLLEEPDQMVAVVVVLVKLEKMEEKVMVVMEKLQ